MLGWDEVVRITSPDAEKVFEAGEDLSAAQYFLVYVDGISKAVKVLGNITDGCFIGVLQNTALEGEPAVVRFPNSVFSQVIPSASISAGDFIQPSTGGDAGKVKAVALGTDGHDHAGDASGPPAAASFTVVVGQAVEAGTAGNPMWARLFLLVM